MTSSLEPTANPQDSLAIEDSALPGASEPPAHSVFHHWLFLGLAVAVLLASFLLQVSGPDTVGLPFFLVNLPPTCGMKIYWGLDCPGCGLTRSFISLAHGNIPASVQFNPAGIVLFAVTIFQVPYRVIQLRRIKAGKVPFDLTMPMLWMFVVLAIVMTGNWVAKLFFF